MPTLDTEGLGEWLHRGQANLSRGGGAGLPQTAANLIFRGRSPIVISGCVREAWALAREVCALICGELFLSGWAPPASFPPLFPLSVFCSWENGPLTLFG